MVRTDKQIQQLALPPNQEPNKVDKGQRISEEYRTQDTTDRAASSIVHPSSASSSHGAHVSTLSGTSPNSQNNLFDKEEAIDLSLRLTQKFAHRSALLPSTLTLLHWKRVARNGRAVARCEALMHQSWMRCIMRASLRSWYRALYVLIHRHTLVRSLRQRNVLQQLRTSKRAFCAGNRARRMHCNNLKARTLSGLMKQLTEREKANWFQNMLSKRVLLSRTSFFWLSWRASALATVKERQRFWSARLKLDRHLMVNYFNQWQLQVVIERSVRSSHERNAERVKRRFTHNMKQHSLNAWIASAMVATGHRICGGRIVSRMRVLKRSRFLHAWITGLRARGSTGNSRRDEERLIHWYQRVMSRSFLRKAIMQWHLFTKHGTYLRKQITKFNDRSRQRLLGVSFEQWSSLASALTRNEQILEALKQPILRLRARHLKQLAFSAVHNYVHDLRSFRCALSTVQHFPKTTWEMKQRCLQELQKNALIKRQETNCYNQVVWDLSFVRARSAFAWLSLQALQRSRGRMLCSRLCSQKVAAGIHAWRSHRTSTRFCNAVVNSWQVHVQQRRKQLGWGCWKARAKELLNSKGLSSQTNCLLSYVRAFISWRKQSLDLHQTIPQRLRDMHRARMLHAWSSDLKKVRSLEEKLKVLNQIVRNRCMDSVRHNWVLVLSKQRKMHQATGEIKNLQNSHYQMELLWCWHNSHVRLSTMIQEQYNLRSMICRTRMSQILSGMKSVLPYVHEITRLRRILEQILSQRKRMLFQAWSAQTQIDTELVMNQRFADKLAGKHFRNIRVRQCFYAWAHSTGVSDGCKHHLEHLLQEVRKKCMARCMHSLHVSAIYMTTLKKKVFTLRTRFENFKAKTVLKYARAIFAKVTCIVHVRRFRHSESLRGISLALARKRRYQSCTSLLIEQLCLRVPGAFAGLRRAFFIKRRAKRFDVYRRCQVQIYLVRSWHRIYTQAHRVKVFRRLAHWSSRRLRATMLSGVLESWQKRAKISLNLRNVCSNIRARQWNSAGSNCFIAWMSVANERKKIVNRVQSDLRAVCAREILRQMDVFRQPREDRLLGPEHYLRNRLQAQRCQTILVFLLSAKHFAYDKPLRLKLARQRFNLCRIQRAFKRTESTRGQLRCWQRTRSARSSVISFWKHLRAQIIAFRRQRDRLVRQNRLCTFRIWFQGWHRTQRLRRVMSRSSARYKRTFKRGYTKQWHFYRQQCNMTRQRTSEVAHNRSIGSLKRVGKAIQHAHRVQRWRLKIGNQLDKKAKKSVLYNLLRARINKLQHMNETLHDRHLRIAKQRCKRVMLSFSFQCWISNIFALKTLLGNLLSAYEAEQRLLQEITLNWNKLKCSNIDCEIRVSSALNSCNCQFLLRVWYGQWWKAKIAKRANDKLDCMRKHNRSHLVLRHFRNGPIDELREMLSQLAAAQKNASRYVALLHMQRAKLLSHAFSVIRHKCRSSMRQHLVVEWWASQARLQNLRKQRDKIMQTLYRSCCQAVLRYLSSPVTTLDFGKIRKRNQSKTQLFMIAKSEACAENVSSHLQRSLKRSVLRTVQEARARIYDMKKLQQAKLQPGMPKLQQHCFVAMQMYRRYHLSVQRMYDRTKLQRVQRILRMWIIHRCVRASFSQKLVHSTKKYRRYIRRRIVAVLQSTLRLKTRSYNFEPRFPYRRITFKALLGGYRMRCNWIQAQRKLRHVYHQKLMAHTFYALRGICASITKHDHECLGMVSLSISRVESSRALCSLYRFYATRVVSCEAENYIKERTMATKRRQILQGLSHSKRASNHPSDVCSLVKRKSFHSWLHGWRFSLGIRWKITTSLLVRKIWQQWVRVHSEYCAIEATVCSKLRTLRFSGTLRSLRDAVNRDEKDNIATQKESLEGRVYHLSMKRALTCFSLSLQARRNATTLIYQTDWRRSRGRAHAVLNCLEQATKVRSLSLSLQMQYRTLRTEYASRTWRWALKCCKLDQQLRKVLRTNVQREFIQLLRVALSLQQSIANARTTIMGKHMIRVVQSWRMAFLHQSLNRNLPTFKSDEPSEAERRFGRVLQRSVLSRWHSGWLRMIKWRRLLKCSVRQRVSLRLWIKVASDERSRYQVRLKEYLQAGLLKKQKHAWDTWRLYMEQRSNAQAKFSRKKTLMFAWRQVVLRSAAKVFQADGRLKRAYTRVLHECDVLEDRVKVLERQRAFLTQHMGSNSPGLNANAGHVLALPSASKQLHVSQQLRLEDQQAQVQSPWQHDLQHS